MWLFEWQPEIFRFWTDLDRFFSLWAQAVYSPPVLNGNSEGSKEIGGNIQAQHPSQTYFSF